MTRRLDTLIVGAGQAGLALSHYLTSAGHEHVLLERGRLGQAWHDRWDSLTLLSPNWMNRLPGGEPHANENGFLDRGQFIAYLDDYARSFGAPVLERTEVRSVRRLDGGFRIDTSTGRWSARNVVIATGDAALPNVPLPAPRGVPSLHGAEYRRPELVQDGPVLVVGASASGQQLALELAASGRDVVLSVGRHGRTPRAYRGRDIFSWVALLGDFDRTIDELADLEAAKRMPLFPLSGANGGEDLGLDRLHSVGIRVAGRLLGFNGTRAVFADDLETNIAKADERLGALVRRIDAHPAARGTRAKALRPFTLPPGLPALDLRRFGAIVWATGYRRAYPWLRIPEALDPRGELIQRQGSTPVPGLYVLGLRFQHRRSSHFIGGVGRDARTLVDAIDRRAGRRGRPGDCHSPGRSEKSVLSTRRPSGFGIDRTRPSRVKPARSSTRSEATLPTLT
jgi:putative flavoprotein involved in K+ transport